MSEFDPADLHQLSAAQGWLELGNPTEAAAELRQMSLAAREHPDALELRWQIGSAAKEWADCVEAGRALTEIAPERAIGWIYHAQALYRLKRYAEAFEALLPAVGRFPANAGVHYDLACYHCLLGRIDEARKSLRTAVALGGEAIKRAALDDPDLKGCQD